MDTDNVVQTVQPDPDSHFRLRCCKVCREQKAVYVRYQAGSDLFWRVECPICGHAVDKRTNIRHEVQVAWNEEDAK